MSIRGLLSIIGTSTSVILLSLNSTQAASLDTRPGDSTQGPFGEPASPFFGQTITISEESNVLTDFTFSIDGFDDPDVVDFVGVVSEWNRNTFRPQGSTLFRSSPRSTTPGSGVEDFRFETGVLPLVGDQQYVLYVEALFNGIEGRGALPQRLDDPISGGDFVISNDGNDWFLATRSSGGVDLAFQTTTISEQSDTPVTVPEPTSVMGLLVIGSLFAAPVLRRKCLRIQ